jgi:hypothetical protein
MEHLDIGLSTSTLDHRIGNRILSKSSTSFETLASQHRPIASHRIESIKLGEGVKGFYGEDDTEIGVIESVCRLSVKTVYYFEGFTVPKEVATSKPLDDWIDSHTDIPASRYLIQFRQARPD